MGGETGAMLECHFETSGLVFGMQVSQPFCVLFLPLASQLPGQAGLQVSALPGHAAQDPAAPATAAAPGVGHGMGWQPWQ